jgi:hypothetical protein
MALDNLISIEFTNAEKNSINNKLTDIETTLASKVVNLTPTQRQEYARLGNETENWIVKVRNYMLQRPDLIPSWLNQAEMDKDLEARQYLTPLIARVRQLLEEIEDTNMLLSTDIYHAALAYYNNVKQASVNNVAGTTSIYQDLQA